jgi:hypothetical protein
MQPSIKWTAPEYRKKERSTDWYWSWGIISLSIIVISIFLHNYAFAVLIAVAVFALITVVMKDSDIFAYEIGEKGIKAGKDFIAYGSIECFWIKDGKEEDLLLLKTNRFLSHTLSIIIEDVDLNDMREFLLTKLKEKELEEPSSKRVMDFLGF